MAQETQVPYGKHVTPIALSTWDLFKVLHHHAAESTKNGKRALSSMETTSLPLVPLKVSQSMKQV